jgi:Protein of unknown function (DUF559)./Uncharacterized conserved protein (DUF2075).
MTLMTEENRTEKDFTIIEKVLLQWPLSKSGKPVVYSYDEVIENLKLLTSSYRELRKKLVDNGIFLIDEENKYHLSKAALKRKIQITPPLDYKSPEKHVISTSANWANFKKLLNYYIRCVRVETRPQYYLRPDRTVKNYYVPGSLPYGWLKSLDEEESTFTVDFKPEGTPVKIAITAAKNSDSSVFLGYPVLASFSRDTGEIEYFCPVTLIPVEYNPGGNKDILDNGLPIKLKLTDVILNDQWFDSFVPDELRKELNLEIDRIVMNSKHPDAAVDLKNTLSTLINCSNNRLDADFNPNYLNQVIPSLKPGKKHSNKVLLNTAVFFNASDLSYNKNELKELEAIKNSSPEELDKTALAYIYREPPFDIKNPISDCIAIPFSECNGEQLDSIEKSLNYPISIIQGPPGTGKSQVAVNIIANCITKGDSILFTSKNHAAINAIRQRSKDIISDNVPILNYTVTDEIRTPWYKTGFESLATEIEKLCNYKTEAANSLVSSAQIEIRQILDKEQEKIVSENENGLTILARDKAYTELRKYFKDSPFRLDDLILIKSALLKDINVLKVREPGLLSKLLSYLKGYKQKDFDEAITDLKVNFPNTYKELQLDHLRGITNALFMIEKIDEYSRLNEKVLNYCGVEEEISSNLKYIKLEDEISANAKEALCQCWFDRFSSLDEDEIGSIKDRQTNISADNRSLIILNARETNSIAKAIKDVHKIIPAWTAPLLSLHLASPLLPGLFDLVVIDEAAQCDPISIIPALFRSKRATIIGDPEQFKPISKLTRERESRLWKQYFQNTDSFARFKLFETSAYSVMPKTISTMLKEHFRCSKGIADYFNDSYYHGQLRIRTEQSRINFPTILENKDSFQWINVSDSLDEEIHKCCELFLKLYENFDGTIGIICPLREVVDKIINELPRNFESDERVTIGTAYSFQGGECDVIIFVTAYNSMLTRGKRWYLDSRENRNIYNVAISRAKACLIVIGDKEQCSNASLPELRNLTNYPLQEKSGLKPFDSKYEELLYNAMMKAGIDNIYPQYSVAGYYLDFAYIGKNVKIDIEVDGETYHKNPDGTRRRSDFNRNNVLMRKGWVVKRFWVHEIRGDIDGCIADIKALIRHQEANWNDKLSKNCVKEQL